MSELPLSVQSELAEVRAMRDRVRDLESQLRDAVEHAESMQRDRDAWKAEAEERLAHIILATQERNHARASLALIDLEKASAKRDWYAEIAAIHHGGSDIAECCSVCFRRVGINTGDDGTPPVDLGRCAAPGGFECRAVGQAVAGYRRENEVLRSNSDHLSSENASLAQQVESMGMRLESLAEELAKPEDVRLREVLDALDGRAVIFDGLGARVGHLLDEMDEWIERAGAAERRLKKAEDVVLLAFPGDES